MNEIYYHKSTKIKWSNTLNSIDIEDIDYLVSSLILNSLMITKGLNAILLKYFFNQYFGISDSIHFSFWCLGWNTLSNFQLFFELYVINLDSSNNS
jgi:hypothetical protein